MGVWRLRRAQQRCSLHFLMCITMGEFAEGIQRVHGSARSIDVVQLLQSNRGMTRMLGEVMRVMHDLREFQEMADSCKRVRSVAPSAVCTMRRSAIRTEI